jgi:hypothetical protein
MNTEMLSPELQLNNMLEQINAQLPNNKAQKVSEIMNSVLGGEMLLRHVGFYKALGGLGDKIKKTVSDITSGESSVGESIINNIVPDALQPVVRGASTALTGGGTQALEQAVSDVLPEAVQPVVSGAATALTGGGTQSLETLASNTINPIVERTTEPLIEASEQAPGFLDRVVSGFRDLGGRISGVLPNRTNIIDDPAPSRDINLDDPSMNLTMDDPFSEGPLNIDFASRRGLYRFAPESGESDSGQNIGNAFMRGREDLPDLPVFDGMREVPQSSSIQEQQAAANREFNSDEPASPPTQQPPVTEQQTPPTSEQTPATQETGAVSAEENIPATIAEEGEGIVAAAVPEVAAATTGAISSTASTLAKVAPEIETGGFELGPLFEGAAILGAVVPQLISLFEKPETTIQSYVGEQIGL